MKLFAAYRMFVLVWAIVCSALAPMARGGERAGPVVYAYTNWPAMAGPADLIIYNAKVMTVDSKFSLAKAIAIRGDRILAVGNGQLEKYKGPDTRLLDAKGATLMPGLYDSHVHSYKAALSELAGVPPVLDSIAA